MVKKEKFSKTRHNHMPQSPLYITTVLSAQLCDTLKAKDRLLLLYQCTLIIFYKCH